MMRGPNENLQTNEEVISVEPLKPYSLPLSGVRLIEASAGTGKTYTITSLYLRLILGHECEPLSPEQILVVTFTRAATDELKDRIRKRLKQAHDALNQKKPDLDPLVEELSLWFEDESVRERSLERLSDAQQLMDLASIFTIHGFCQRMLSQNAFEARGGFEDQLTLEEGQYLTQAVRDVWRRSIYQMDSAGLDIVLQRWRTPDKLEADVRPYLHKSLTFHFGQSESLDDQSFELKRQAWESLTEKLVAKWDSASEELLSLFLNHPQKNGQFTRFLTGRMDAIQRILNAPHSQDKEDLKKLSYLCADQLSKSVKKGAEAPQHPLLTLLDDWFHQNDFYQNLKNHWLDQWFVDHIQLIRDRLSELKQQQQVLAPDDLLSGLANAMAQEGGDRLVAQIRRQYPVAMVDEFQDTDALQYSIFRSLYVTDSDESALALLMIGDPKQAIYKFRGADIFTYIKAKHEVQGAYSLDTNYRSSQDMENAVNHVFSQHSRPFIYDSDIPFQPVLSADKGKPLTYEGKKASALTWQLLNVREKPSKEYLNSRFAASAAESISTLLNQSQNEQANIDGKKIQAQDIAVLVRSGRQAEFVKQALNERGIASVYVGRDSIFATEEALSVFGLLQAVHEQNERSFKNALAHPIWGLSLAEIEQFNTNEQLWEKQLDALHKALQDWQYKGVMTMLTNWLHDRGMPAIWLQDKNHGERRLTNVLHLAEILQQASVEQQGMQGLISWFAQQLANATGDNETQQLRLESDENLVQITTLHKSKGLEYPIVFMPFLWDGKVSNDTIFYDETTKQATCDLAGDFKDQIQTEGLAEEIRLLYVGLTRAVSKCYVGVYTSDDIKHLSAINQSALKYCMGGYEKSFDQVMAHIQVLSDQQPDLWNVQFLSDEVTQFSAPESNEETGVNSFYGEIPKQWRLSSFSSLIKKVQAPEAPKFDLDDDQVTQDDTAEQTVETQDVLTLLEKEDDCQQELSPFTFPRGAHAGNFLHNLLEEVDFTDPLKDENREQAIHLMERYGFDADQWTDVVMDWLQQILVTPLQHPDLSLSKLTDAHKLVEMEFYFPVTKLTAAQLNRLFIDYPCLNVPYAEVAFSDLKGMLKGFVDLIFEWQGQYFVLDYKSNHLGNHESEYHDSAVQHAMAKNRYDVQMVIYTLALHRLLKLRIPNYDYDQHIGGGYYLFLRGMKPDQALPYGQYFHKPNKALIESLDAMISQEDLAASNSLDEQVTQ